LRTRCTSANFEASRGVLPRKLQRVMARQTDRPAMPDRLLVERIAAGDEQALGALYDRHGGTAYSLALTIVGERADAEEVVVDAFGQAWRTAGQFDPARGSVAAWLATITRARALDLVRARGRRARILTRAAYENPEVLATSLAATGDDPEQGAEREETRRLVERSLGELPEPQRRVIELAYFAGLTQTEIATELREPLGTVKTRMRAAMEKLRSSLTQLLSEGGA
jgi:RNA polymerase sigma-70 factor (ECF subfamily)